MDNLLTPKDIAEGIASLAAVNPLFSGKKLNVFVIANEYAGSFKQKRKSINDKSILAAAVSRAKAKQSVVEAVSTKLFVTEYSGHAEKLAHEIIDGIVGSDSAEKTGIDFVQNGEDGSEQKTGSDFVRNENPNGIALPEKSGVFNLIVAAGGDGTSLEVQTALYNASMESEEKKKAVMDDVAVLRMPLGTGCDGTDGHDFSETITLLENPLHFANSRAIKVWHSGNPTKEDFEKAGKNPEKYGNEKEKAPWYAFNIAGIGVDGYVCYMTNRMKSKLPGNSYSLCVDLASLFYDLTFPSGTAHIKAYNESDDLTGEFNKAIELVTFGVSGHRTFGSGKKVFPDDGNFAIIRKVSALALAQKSHTLYDGSYINTDLGKTYKAKKIVIDYDKPILLELDGETHLLIKESFPLTMELTEPCIQVLESDSIEWDRGTVRK